MNKREYYFSLFLLMLASFTLLSCKIEGKESKEKKQSSQIGIEEKTEKKEKKVKSKIETSKEQTTKIQKKSTTKKIVKIENSLEFLDAYKNRHRTKIDTSLKMHSYKPEKFRRKGDKLFYEDEVYTSELGIDVSHHQKNIDWKKVKNFGIDFAFIRIGARGYGKSGSLIVDREYARNIKEAKKQGIKVGVYFYSQALNEKEAVEEADFVLKLLKKENLDLPVIYDPEHALEDNGKRNIGRNANVSGKQNTINTLAFFEKMEKAGYLCGVYSNMMWQAYEYDMKKIENYPMWYADYEKNPQTPYMFEYWQYSNVGRVPGVPGNTDLNIRMVEK